MSTTERLSLNSAILSSYRDLSRTERRKILPRTNLLLAWDCSPHGDFLTTGNQAMIGTLNRLQELGFTPISEAYFLHGFAWLIDKYVLTIPYAGQYQRNEDLRDNAPLRRRVAKERTRFFNTLRARLEFVLEDGSVHIYENEEGQLQDITQDVIQTAVERKETIEELFSYDTISGNVLSLIRNFVQHNQGLAVLVGTNRLETVSPLIGINTSHNLSAYMHRNADRIHVGTNTPLPTILREAVSFTGVNLQREKLREMIQQGEIDVIPAFPHHNWPRYGLMEHVRKQVQSAIKRYILDNKIICDPLDAQYQVLFRLTSFDVADIFQNGKDLAEYLESAGAFSDWQILPLLDEKIYGEYFLRDDLLQAVIQEQLSLVQLRVSQSALPVRDIVMPSGIFAEEGWELKKRDGKITAIKHDRDGNVIAAKPVHFRQVSNELAGQFHQDLHYIHTPRAEVSFGLFLDGEDLPFSILSATSVDRPYKQNTLLLFGYDPRYCLDFTRLYSRPGTPHNTSSAMFGQAFAHIRRTYTKTEAAISSFMPSYASGLSMLTGGFETPILVKPNVHYFKRTSVNGDEVLEHVTKRRQNPGYDDVTKSRMPLLPVIELISPITQPRFEPTLQLGRDMVELKE